MLKCLRIEGYALIDALEIQWNEGLTAITGETGSGKSIVLGALGLALGERSDASIIRKDAAKCVVEARFEADLSEALDALGLDKEEEVCLRREVTAKGRSRAFINDTPVAVNDLKKIGRLLVDLHGQDESRALSERAHRIALIDSFASDQKRVQAYKTAFFDWQNTVEGLKEMQAASNSPMGDADYLAYQLNELLSLKLDSHDAEEIQEEWNTLQHASAIRNELQQTAQILANDDRDEDVISALALAAKSLTKAASMHGPADALANRISSIRAEAEDLLREVEMELDQVQEDPERSDQLSQWLDELNRLLVKHRAQSSPELAQKAIQMQQALDDIEHRDARLKELQISVDRNFQRVQETGLALQIERQKNADQLAKDVKGHLAGLKMADAEIKVVWSALTVPDEDGLDDVEWHFRSHVTSTFQPLNSVASGGEKSRLMLAIKAVQTAHASARTIILDEIDTGVSGQVADCMAQLMDCMAQHQQVIAVTHLPQVAGHATHHMKVSKLTSPEAVHTQVTHLTPEGRVQELAEMLSGAQVTSAATDHAISLLQRS